MTMWSWKPLSALIATVVFVQREPVSSQEGAELSEPADVPPLQAAVSAESGPHRHPHPHTHRYTLRRCALHKYDPDSVCVCVFAVSMEAVGADDLLSVILYLLVKTEIPNW